MPALGEFSVPPPNTPSLQGVVEWDRGTLTSSAPVQGVSGDFFQR